MPTSKEAQLAAPEQQSEWAADIGTRVFWLALLVGLIVGGLGTGFHLLVDALAQARMVLVAGGFDQFLQLQRLVQLTNDLMTRYDRSSPRPWPLPAGSSAASPPRLPVAASRRSRACCWDGVACAGDASCR